MAEVKCPRVGWRAGGGGVGGWHSRVWSQVVCLLHDVDFCTRQFLSSVWFLDLLDQISKVISKDYFCSKSG